MFDTPLTAIVGRLVRRLPPTDSTSDDALLARFVGWRDEAAFELLVYRHVPMVRSLCRRVLRHEQDAEDAFQATFLAFAKKAASIRGQSLAGWLYRVAFHAALKARQRAVRRETSLPEIAISFRNGTEDRELSAVLDEEILRLPERFRLPVLLCYMQGRSNSEAAASLGIPKGTVDSRLSTARQRLRVRLMRRGFAPAVAGAAIEGSLDAAEVPGSVARAVTKAAVAFLSKQAGVPAAAAVLAEGVLHTMFVSKLTWAVAAVVTLAMLGSGAGVATYGALAGDGPPAKVADEKKTERPAKPPAANDANITIASVDFTPQTAASVRKLLNQPAKLDKGFDGAPLKDILEYLSDKYSVAIRIDPGAMSRFHIDKPYAIGDMPVSLPVTRSMTLGQVLHDVLAQVKDNEMPPITYKVKGAQIVIVPAYMIPGTRAGHQEGDERTPTINPDIVEEQVEGDPVSVEVQNKPLAEVLHELADSTGSNIVLDGRQKEKGQTPVTITLQNVRLFTALRVIADMADLQPTTIGNVYYVTDKANAERLYRQEWLLRPAAPDAKPADPTAVGK
jgi:RNA polymerase sigma factor (sigma-70 family)